MGIGSKLLTTLAVLAVWSCSAAPDAGDEAPYPVWWSSELALDTLDDIDDRMSIEFPRDQWTIVVRSRDMDKAIIDDCVSLASLGSTYDPWFSNPISNENVRYYFLAADCEALAMLKEATAANKSYLRDFVFSPKALEFLPALMIDHWTALPSVKEMCELTCDILHANAKEIPWSRYEDVSLIDVRSEDNMAVWARGRGVRLTIVGRGDFDGDKIDDILIKRHFLSPRQAWARTDVILLTRHSWDAVMRVLNIPSNCVASYGWSGCPQIE